MPATDVFHDLVRAQKSGVPAGICSVCSSHPWVLRAAMAEGKQHSRAVLIESTVNQVNQDGGYSGLVPADFRDLVHKLADEVGLPPERVLLGADHVGPYPWADLPAESAIDKACVLAAELVKAGYAKIHLDASLPLQHDSVAKSGGLDPLLVAQREARIAAAAEGALGRAATAPVYVIGSDVPAPGGTTSSQSLPITSAEAFGDTVEACRDTFRRAGLAKAWDRVVAVVVQLGAEFGDGAVDEYDRVRARPVCAAARNHPQLVLEAHSTDHQQPAALQQMVEDGAAILKVGPALSFALRETLFALEHIEAELSHRLSETRSNLRGALERAMDANPRHWRGHFDAQNDELRLKRAYSLFDRCRYYWTVPEVDVAVRRLIGNLRGASIPLTLLSQFCPTACARIRRGELSPDPEAIVEQQIRDVLAIYGAAVNRG